MGLSGAEDEIDNQRFVDFLKDQHGDIAFEFLLVSDAVIAIATSFQKGLCCQAELAKAAWFFSYYFLMRFCKK